MNKLEQLLADAIRAGKLTMAEALAVSGAVHWVNGLSWNPVAMDDFTSHYGQLALRELPGLISQQG
jgi:hypothetical protein